MNQLSHIKNTEKEKLRFFSNVYTTFELQKSQTFGIIAALFQALTPFPGIIAIFSRLILQLYIKQY